MNAMNIKKALMPIAILLCLIILVAGCTDEVTDFGFNGAVTGRILDQNGNIVAGDVTANNLLVYLLGEQDTEPLTVRVLGDGTYTNTHLYPQKYTLSVRGAVMPVEDATVDLTGDMVVKDFTVIPLLTLAAPNINASGGAVTVGYNIAENAGNVAETRVVYVSTVPYPGPSTGSGAYWTTLNESVDQNQGDVTITGLESGKKYHVRIAARAEGSTYWNFSEQASFNAQ